MSHWQGRVESERLLSKGLGHWQIVSTQHHPCSEQIGRWRIRKEVVLCGKGPARIVVTLRVKIAESEHVVVVNVAGRDREMRLFEQGNRQCRFASQEKSDALHLHCFAIGRILNQGALKSLQ